jgi:hypothetical protein
MTKSKTIAVALTLAATFATSGQAQAHSRWYPGLGIGFTAGTLIGTAAVSNSYANGYRECRYADRLDSWGYMRTIKVCDDVVPY